MNSHTPEGNAVVYCDGMFNTPSGKTAHGLVRFTKRYQVVAVIDDRYAGQDAGKILDGKDCGIPVVAGLDRACALAETASTPLTHFVIGLAPDGGRLNANAREAVKDAIANGLHVDCGLHDYLSEDPEISMLAHEYGVLIRDVRKPPDRNQLNFFSGKIEEVMALKVAVLGTDSAVGKRTSAWMIVNGLLSDGISAQIVGTGQTAWMQGAAYSIIIDSLVNDFVSGEIEHAVWRAWDEEKPDVIVIEGQGSLMNPAYPGGFEILAAGRPDIVVLQHAPARKDYDGFPGYSIHPLARQIETIQMVSDKPVVAVTVNHEGLEREQIPWVCDAIETITGLPAVDLLTQGPAKLLRIIKGYMKG